MFQFFQNTQRGILMEQGAIVGKINYYVVWDSKVGIFTEKINTMLANGWELYGNPFSVSPFLYQALTKKLDTSAALPSTLKRRARQDSDEIS